MNFNPELNDIFNLGLLIGFASLWIFHVLYFWVPLFVPSARNQIKLKDIDLNTISSFTMHAGGCWSYYRFRYNFFVIS